MNLMEKLRQVPDFPKEGINFIDITTVLQDAIAFKETLDRMKEILTGIGDFDVIIGPEARGFIFAAPMAYALGKSFVPIRKKGKLPYKTVSVEYELEYGTDILEIHEDAIMPGQKVVIVDDLLATGGTALSNISLIEKLGGQVAGLVYFIELDFLEGRKKLQGYNVHSIVRF